MMTEDTVLYNKGPEQIKCAENLWTTDAEGVVKLRVSKEGIGTKQPVSVPGLLTKVANEYGNHTALCYKQNNAWESITYR